MQAGTPAPQRSLPHTETGETAQCHLLFVSTLWGRRFCPAVGLPADAVCEEFAVIHRQKSQLRSGQRPGRKAEALPHESQPQKVSGIGSAYPTLRQAKPPVLPLLARPILSRQP